MSLKTSYSRDSSGFAGTYIVRGSSIAGFIFSSYVDTTTFAAIL
jgi:hypothetical protein